MSRLFAIILFTFSGAAAYASVEAPHVWNQVENAKGIAIFERDEGGLMAFRAEGTVDAPIRNVAAALLDTTRTTEWVERLEEDKIVRRLGPGKYLEYTHVGTPIVLKDRDFLCEVTVSLNEKEKELVIESHSVEDASMPPTKFVRGHIQKIEFRLRPGEAGKTTVSAEFHVDPKGTVPRWVVNLFQRAWPKKSFHAIQKQVASGNLEMPPELETVLAPLASF